MKDRIIKLLYGFGVKSARTKNIVKHVGVSFFYKGGAVLANFLLVPITIDYLDTENYGVWLTLSSFIAWFSFFDVGLGNGLRNKFAEAKSSENMNLARAYISSAYYTIVCISVAIFIMFFVVNYFVDWTKVFNSNIVLREDLSILMPAVVGFFCLQLITKLITSIYLGDQNHSIQVKIHFITQVLSLLLIWILINTSDSSLLIFGIVFSALPVIVLIGLNVFGFSTRFKNFKPTLSLWKRKYLKDIMGIGVNFFIIQIAGLVLFSTDNFIISKLFGPEEVVPYNVAFKYFSIITMIFTIIVAPYWSSFTEAYIKGEYQWIKKSIKNIFRIWLFIPLLLIIMIIISGWFYNIWVGDKVLVPMALSVSMALFVLIHAFNTIFVMFINGTGKIKLQLLLSIFVAIINIPLSIFLAKNLGLGVKGVILATIFCNVPGIILMPLQYSMIVRNIAKGIWNK